MVDSNECSGTSVRHNPSLASTRRLLRTEGDNEKAVTDLPKLGSDLFFFTQAELFLQLTNPYSFRSDLLQDVLAYRCSLMLEIRNSEHLLFMPRLSALSFAIGHTRTVLRCTRPLSKVAIEVIMFMIAIFLFLPTGNFNIIILDRVKLNIALVRNKRSF